MTRVNASGLDSIKKFCFLRSSLIGPPVDLIDALEVDSGTHTKALTVLIERYERKRFLIDTHVYFLLEIKRSTSPASKDLCIFLSDFNKHFESLRSQKTHIRRQFQHSRRYPGADHLVGVSPY